MKEYIKNIIAESLKDEVDVDREWERLFSSIEKNYYQNENKKAIPSVHKNMPLPWFWGIGILLSTLYLRIKRTYRQLEIIN